MRIHVDEDIARAEGLPAECFSDEAFLERELATIFTRSWLLLPERTPAELRDDARSLQELVAPRGGRAPLALVGRPLFLQRGWEDETLRLFPNTCTHAWFPLVTGAGRSNSLTCAQHGRKFDARGRFVSQPGFDGLPGFPRECDHLSERPVRSWLSQLFTCLGTPAAAFDETIAPIEASLARLPIDRLARQLAASSQRELDGNWKQHAWNYMDAYHVTWIHRAPGGLADRIDMTSYATELHGSSSLQWAFARDVRHGFDPDLLPARFRDESGKGRRVFALWWFLFPNLTLNFYPWGLSVNSYDPVPGKPERTFFRWEHYVLDEARYAERDAVWLNSQVDGEDIDAMAQVRRGLRSGFAPRPRFSATDDHGPHWFHRLVAEGVG